MTTPHFTPPQHWLNDPNGLVRHAGRYHLFYQYNPNATAHGDMSWGHASSTDLFSWEHHPVALLCSADDEIYSGSVVVDEAGTSGYGSAGAPALVALYTSLDRHTRIQAQCLAYSLDEGLTWTRHAGNPVLDRGSTQFRDPKVLRWEGDGEAYWVMVAVEAVAREVHFFRSDDLLSWTPLCVVGGVGATFGVWECPDLFPLVVDTTGERHWVLLVSLLPRGPEGGSGTQYFVGGFDGVAFTALQRPGPAGSTAWLDHGTDNYAGVTYFGLPDDERTLIAWMSNWAYAHDLPLVHGTLGMMTLPRRLGLTLDATSWPVLTQLPVLPEALEWSELGAGELAEAGAPAPVAMVLHLTLHVPPGDCASIRLRARPDGTGGVLVRVTGDEVTLDRTAAFEGMPDFANLARAPRVLGTDRAELLIVLDEHSVEVFADRGTAVLTSRIIPEPQATGLAIHQETPGAALGPVRLGRLP